MSDYNTLKTVMQVDYSTNRKNLRAVNPGGADEYYIDLGTGERVEVLADDKFDWKGRKRKGLRLGDIYKHLHERSCKVSGLNPAQSGGRWHDEARKVYACSTWLEYMASGQLDRRQLLHFNACKKRLCPICAARRAKQTGARLARVVDKVRADHDGVQYIFLTLTVRNVPGDKLGDALSLLASAWSKLTRRRAVARAIKGYFRAVEITYNRAANTYHPHIHAMLAVENAYFDPASGLYLTHEKWVELWRSCLQVNYNPSVRVSATYSKNGKADRRAGGDMAAVLEAAKYATKDNEYLDLTMPLDRAADVVGVYTTALYKRRLTALGGWLLDAAQALDIDLDADGDLVHDGEQGELTLKTAELLENWGWHRMVRAHILEMRWLNPDYEPPDDKGGGSS